MSRRSGSLLFNSRGSCARYLVRRRFNVWVSLTTIEFW